MCFSSDNEFSKKILSKQAILIEINAYNTIPKDAKTI